jgi:hypothetical protein
MPIEGKIFRANPIPRSCSVLIFEQQNELAAKARTQRVAENAEKSLKNSKMPPTMAAAEKKKKAMAQVDKREQYSFMPKIGPPVTAAQLKAKQLAFEKKMDKSKSEATGTKQMPFNFSKSSSTPLERRLFNEGKIPLEQIEDKQTKFMRQLAEKTMKSVKEST